MKVFALTGGMGAGKSTVAELLDGAGIPVIDTDAVARQLVAPGEPALEAIHHEFGSAVMNGEGGLDRAALARVVFPDPAARQRLERILHPRIRDIWAARVRSWHNEGRPVGVVVIPLLFEIDAEHEVDCTVCVACSAAAQWLRLRARGWEDEEIRYRLAAQLPLAEKMCRADRVIWNDGSRAVLIEQVRRTFCSPRMPLSGA